MHASICQYREGKSVLSELNASILLCGAHSTVCRMSEHVKIVLTLRFVCSVPLARENFFEQRIENVRSLPCLNPIDGAVDAAFRKRKIQ